MSKISSISCPVVYPFMCKINQLKQYTASKRQKRSGNETEPLYVHGTENLSPLRAGQRNRNPDRHQRLPCWSV